MKRLTPLKPGQEPKSWNTDGLQLDEFEQAMSPTYKIRAPYRDVTRVKLPWRVILFTVALVVVVGLIKLGMR